MRKTVVISLIIFVVWLVLNDLHVSDMFVNFFLVGALPGSATASLSPTMMLAIMTALAGVVLLEILGRRFDIARKIRNYFANATKKQDRLPKRRLGRA